jgi:acyl-coenzyme A thioesterase 13
MVVEHAEKGVVRCSLPVTTIVQNSYGTLHGGAIGTIIDVVGTLALLADDPKRGGVSVDLNVNFLNPAKLGDSVTVEGRVLKTGKSLGFTEVDIKRVSGNRITLPSPSFSYVR